MGADRLGKCPTCGAPLGSADQACGSCGEFVPWPRPPVATALGAVGFALIVLGGLLFGVATVCCVPLFVFGMPGLLIILFFLLPALLAGAGLVAVGLFLSWRRPMATRQRAFGAARRPTDGLAP